jgi:putative exporter of polyketide antibiotics
MSHYQIIHHQTIIYLHKSESFPELLISPDLFFHLWVQPVNKRNVIFILVVVLVVFTPDHSSKPQLIYQSTV